jgi:8-oxo-dGTP pyrophosphatase MutT (NUDIX family)
MLWRELAREHVADCRIFSVERSVAESPHDHTAHTFFRILSADWVQVLPITKNREAVLVRQYRHGARQVTIEIPGGVVEDGEDLGAAALRECLEETGYTAPKALPLGVQSPNPALFSNRLFSFYAPDADLAGRIQNTGTEHTEVLLVPLRDLPNMLASGAIDHSLVAATLWRYLYEFDVR